MDVGVVTIVYSDGDHETKIFKTCEGARAEFLREIGDFFISIISESERDTEGVVKFTNDKLITLSNGEGKPISDIPTIFGTLKTTGRIEFAYESMVLSLECLTVN